MEPITILLMVLVVAGIWAVVELALTIRHARSSVDDVVRSANETIEQVQPIIAKLDGMADELEPTLKEVPALLEKTGATIDTANESLSNVNAILVDVSSVSGVAAGVTEQVNRAAGAAASGVSNLVGRITGNKGASAAQLTEGAPAEGAPAADEAPAERSYVVYGEAEPKAEDEPEAAPADPNKE